MTTPRRLSQGRLKGIDPALTDLLEEAAVAVRRVSAVDVAASEAESRVSIRTICALVRPVIGVETLSVGLLNFRKWSDTHTLSHALFSTHHSLFPSCGFTSPN